ncbi:MAG TPA: hypothetical protein VFQ61_39165, partial [Polyangiaceae bacterium]|nr:hypothetical protein [Polyangiaceae bacterium]
MPETISSLDPLATQLAPPLELAARIRSAVAQTPAPRSSLRERRLWLLVAIPFAVAAGPLGSHLFFRTRPTLRVDLAQVPWASLTERLGALLLLASIATGVVVAPGRRGLGAQVLLLLTAAIAVTPLYTLVTTLGPLQTPAGQLASRELHPLGLPCAGVAVAVGALMLIAFTVALRRSVPVASTTRAAALGAAAGAWAGLALFLQCPASDAL